MHSMPSGNGDSTICNFSFLVAYEIPKPTPSTTPSTQTTANVVSLDYRISPLLFGNGVVSFNRDHGLLFGAVLPGDFFEK